jgi:hypothetical protein
MLHLYIDIDDVLFSTAGCAIRKLQRDGHDVSVHDLRLHPTVRGWTSLAHLGITDEVWTAAVRDAVTSEDLRTMDDAEAGLRRLHEATDGRVTLLTARPASTTRRTLEQLEQHGLRPYALRLIHVENQPAKADVVGRDCLLIDDMPVNLRPGGRQLFHARVWNADLPGRRMTWYDVVNSSDLHNLLEWST